MIATAQKQKMGKQNLDHLERGNALRIQQSRLERRQTPTYQDVSHLGHCAQSNQNVTRTAYHQLVYELEIPDRAAHQMQQKLNALCEQQSRNEREVMPPRR